MFILFNKRNQNGLKKTQKSQNRQLLIGLFTSGIKPAYIKRHNKG